MIEFDWKVSKHNEAAIKAEYQANTGVRYLVGVVKKGEDYLAKVVRGKNRKLLSPLADYGTLTEALRVIHDVVAEDIEDDLLVERQKADAVQAVQAQAEDMARQAQVWRP